ncbi:MAG: glycoside hydrolase family 32 protein [Mangrovibacterium sp.]
MSRKIILSLLLLVTSLSSTWANSKEDSTLVYRPAYHFTPQQNAMGAPVGIIHDGNTYHLFYEYNAEGLSPDNYSLGHATSTDLIQWSEQPVAYTPGGEGLQGASCVLDEKNVLAKQEGNQKTYVLSYGVAGKGVKIAYSTNAGASWQELGSAMNLACDVEEQVCDPKLIWYAPTQSFVLMVSRMPEGDTDAEGISFYTSSNLKDWTFASHIRGLKGNPDLFELPVNGDDNKKKWVLSDDRGNYMLGEFNGKSFSALTAKLENQGGEFHSPTTFIDAQAERTVQIASLAKSGIDGASYSGALTIPMELSLTQHDGETAMLVKKPVKELYSLPARQALNLRNKKLIPGINDNPINKLKGVSTHINAQFNINNVDAFGFLVLNSRKEEGTELMYNAKTKHLSWMGDFFTLELEDKRLNLEIWVDKSTVEIFVNGGETIISTQIVPSIGNEKYVLAGQGGELIIESLKAQKLK